MVHFNIIGLILQTSDREFCIALYPFCLLPRFKYSSHSGFILLFAFYLHNMVHTLIECMPQSLGVFKNCSQGLETLGNDGTHLYGRIWQQHRAILLYVVLESTQEIFCAVPIGIPMQISKESLKNVEQKIKERYVYWMAVNMLKVYHRCDTGSIGELLNFCVKLQTNTWHESKKSTIVKEENMWSVLVFDHVIKQSTYVPLKFSLGFKLRKAIWFIKACYLYKNNWNLVSF